MSCNICGKEMNNPNFTTCFVCKFGTDENQKHCSGCDKIIEQKYDICFTCKFGSSDKLTKKCKCGKIIFNKYSECYNCYMNNKCNL